ncbi:MAG TPA: lysophospholipid acyltransferase family protein [Candidatus Limnocylindria bacterium]|nr:lysophospholipid acyltransferase family protein [Candidatus Limnocylindria bacterium]
MLERITHTNTPSSPVVTQRRQIAHIVARESAETLVGRPAGFRVEVLRRLIGPVAHHVAGRFVTYDRALGDAGLRHGSAWIVDDATGGLAVEGREHVPARGPLLIVANHPGLSDAVALLAALGRDDAWIVAANYPFLRALRLASRRFLFVSEDRADRLSAFRRIVSALRRGETVVVFPAGGLELDPALSRVAALASLATWSRSIELLARLARDTLVVPAAVRGVVSPSAFDHPLAKRRGVLKERQRMATLLQLALPAYRANRVRIAFGVPIAPGRTRDVHAAVLDAMHALIGTA